MWYQPMHTLTSVLSNLCQIVTESLIQQGQNQSFSTQTFRIRFKVSTQDTSRHTWQLTFLEYPKSQKFFRNFTAMSR